MNSYNPIEDQNLSVAWGKAFLKVFHEGEVAPMTVKINVLDCREPEEIPSIRRNLDASLNNRRAKLSCDQVANTIFPISLWNPNADRRLLYKRYRRICPRILRHRSNRNGVYFQRFIAYGGGSCTQGGVNQLEHIIQTWHRGNHRRSALQAAVFDPLTDHTHQRQRGFPCLQQVAFAGKNGGLSVTGFYATQYIFERAYGNYLGLFRLGRFMAHEMKLRLEQVICVASPAKLSGVRKRDLSALAEQVKEALEHYAYSDDFR